MKESNLNKTPTQADLEERDRRADLTLLSVCLNTTPAERVELFAEIGIDEDEFITLTKKYRHIIERYAKELEDGNISAITGQPLT